MLPSSPLREWFRLLKSWMEGEAFKSGSIIGADLGDQPVHRNLGRLLGLVNFLTGTIVHVQ